MSTIFTIGFVTLFVYIAIRTVRALSVPYPFPEKSAGKVKIEDTYESYLWQLKNENLSDIECSLKARSLRESLGLSMEDSVPIFHKVFPLTQGKDSVPKGE